MLEESGVEVQSAELTMEPNAVVEIGGRVRGAGPGPPVEALDDHDDVEAVQANFDIPAELLEQAAA